MQVPVCTPKDVCAELASDGQDPCLIAKSQGVHRCISQVGQSNSYYQCYCNEISEDTLRLDDWLLKAIDQDDDDP